MTSFRVTWSYNHLVIEQRVFASSLSAHRFVRKRIASLPSSCHAKWCEYSVLVMSGPDVHSSFKMEVIRG